MKHNKIAAVVKASLLGGMMSVTSISQLHAQQQDAEQPEKITVTGSRIKRVTMEGPAPIEVISADDIQASGLDTLTEVLQTLTGSNGSILSNVSDGSTNRSATSINLRGIGDNRTLVLVDGVRVTKFPGSIGGTRNSFDTDILPSDAVERIEILHGGASAIYGSDAMGGVVNVILKKSYKGTSVKGRISDTQHGGRGVKRFSVTHGFELAGTDNLFVAEFQDIEALYEHQRDMTAGHGAFNTRWYSSWSAAITDRSKLFHDSSTNVPTEQGCNELFGENARYVPGYWSGRVYPEEIEKYRAQGGDPFSKEGIAYLGENFGLKRTSYRCRYDTINDNETLTPDKERFNLTYVNTLELDSGWRLRNTATYYRKKSDQNDGIPSRRSRTFYRDSETGAFSYDSGAFDDYDRFQVRRAFFEHGNTHQLIKNTAWNWTSHLSGTVGEYDVDFVAAYGEATRFRRGTNYQSEQGLLDVVTVDPNDPLRGTEKWYPFDKLTEAQADVIRSERIYDSEASATNLSATITGELVSDFFGNGAIDFAAIVEYNDEEFTDYVILPKGPLINLGGADGDGKRKRYAAAAEFAVPLMEDDVLVTNIALRYDYYDDKTDVGGAFTPQIDFAFRPTEEILVRARYAETFRAPDLQRITTQASTLYSSTSLRLVGQLPFYDRESDSFASITSGSLDLEEETGKTWNLGMVYQITDDLTANFDFWNVELDGAVRSISRSYMLREDNQATFNRTGEAANCHDLNGPGFLVGTVSMEGSDGVTRDYLDIECFRNGPINAARQDTRGVDFGAKYSIDTDLGRFKVSSNATYLAYRKTQDFSDAEVRDSVEDFYNPEWKVNTSVNWRYNDWSTTLSWYFIGEMKGEQRDVDQVDPVTLIPVLDEDGKRITLDSIEQTYDSWNKFNLTTNYYGFENTRISLGIINLFDEEPVLDPIYARGFPYYNRSSGQNLYGREFYISAEYKF